MISPNASDVLQVTLQDAMFFSYHLEGNKENIKWTEISLTKPSVVKDVKYWIMIHIPFNLTILAVIRALKCLLLKCIARSSLIMSSEFLLVKTGVN